MSLDLDLSKLKMPANRWRTNLWQIIDTPGGITDVLHEERTIVGHKDNQGGFWLLAFEDIEHAGRVCKEYEEQVQNEAHIVSFNVYSIPEEWNLRLYRMDGTWIDIQQWDYLQRLHEQSK